MNTSLKDALDAELGPLRYIVSNIKVVRHAMRHGEAGTEITARMRTTAIKELTAWYGDKDKLSNVDMAELFVKKLDSIARNKYEESSV